MSRKSPHYDQQKYMRIVWVRKSNVASKASI
jgi:hypothetical protein